MGLFNFIYKLTNILSNKRKLRIFFIIAIVVILVFCWSRGSFASTPTDDLAIQNHQLLMQASMIDYLRFLKQRNNTGFDLNAYNTILTALANFQVYVTIPSDGQTTRTLFSVYFYAPNNRDNNVNIFNVDGVYSLGLNSGTEIPCKLGSIVPSWTASINLNGSTTTPVITQGGSTMMPSACYCIRSTSINEFLVENGYYSTFIPTYNTSDEELQSITQAGFANEVNAVNNATNAINDVNSSVEDVNQSVMDMIDTIVDPYVNVSQQQLPENNVQDPTTDGLDNIFTIIKDAFTGTPQSVSFPIPFTDKSFTIEPRIH